ncbi:hypothetical protein PV327_007027 [Microctonus hyperodae]|uniref:Ribosome assembly factor mrt4 n=1 Tax=Microctonus hyperodae TaxID=165561 RepID=A0AA39F5L5_MICHY|nr:hypothetical protein PV327_007027 [Microctonus hyperodae]
MPKSKRDKKISLTKTSKKGVALKQHIIDDIRTCIDKYARIFVFSVENMRNNKLKDLREEWKDSRFFFGKNKIMALGMGKTPNALKGQCGLLFTNKPHKKVQKLLTDYSEEDYARSGFVVSETIVLPEGPLPDFSHAIEPHLRQLGMPTALQKGVVTLLQDYEVCKSGQALTPEQARILKLFGRPLATFKLNLIGYYSKKKGYLPIAIDDDIASNEQIEMETENVDET